MQHAFAPETQVTLSLWTTFPPPHLLHLNNLWMSHIAMLFVHMGRVLGDELDRTGKRNSQAAAETLAVAEEYD